MELDEFKAIVEEARRAKPKLFLMSSPDAPAGAEQLALLEERLRLQLPNAYRDFLREFGGGDFGLVSVYSADENSDWYLLTRAEGAWARDLPRDLLPFTDDAMGGFYGFRLLNGRAGEEVFYWDHETRTTEPTEFADTLQYLRRYAFEPA